MPYELDTGTTALFFTGTVPPGWTTLTTYNDYSLAVTNGDDSGSPTGAGGYVRNGFPFTSVFADHTVSGTINTANGATIGVTDSTTLTTAQLPSHTHTVRFQNGGWYRITPTATTTIVAGVTGQGGPANPTYMISSTGATTSPTGGGSHNHLITVPSISFTGSPFNLSVKYTDVLRAQKD